MISVRWREQLKKKFATIPNGIDDFWHNNYRKKGLLENQKVFKIIYVGQIQRRKHVIDLISAVNQINKVKELAVELVVVGGANAKEKEYYQNVLRAIDSSKYVEYKGVVKEKESLLKYYREASCFAMIAEHELFGLVYIEALSQGLPVIYKQGEGISGFLRNANCGIAVNQITVESIQTAILNCINNYNSLTINKSLIGVFNWSDIALSYRSLYRLRS